MARRGDRRERHDVHRARHGRRPLRGLEKRLRPLLVEAFRRAGAAWWAVDDPSGAQFLGTLRFTRRRPFDYLMVHAGRPHAVEVKVARPSFRLRPHQDAELARMERAGGRSVVAVFERHGGGRAWRLWWLPYRAYKEYLGATGRGSFPASALAGRAFACPRVAGAFLLPTGRSRPSVRLNSRILVGALKGKGR